MGLSEKDIEIIRALQGDVEASPRPFAALAERLDVDEQQLIEKIKAWKSEGIIRRFGALVAHRRAGVAANGMIVWDVPEEDIERLGAVFSAHRAVSHCYARPRFPGWPYRLYTMAHGRTREQVLEIAKELSDSSGCKNYSILFSTKEFKKSDTRLFFEDEPNK